MPLLDLNEQQKNLVKLETLANLGYGVDDLFLLGQAAGLKIYLFYHLHVEKNIPAKNIIAILRLLNEERTILACRKFKSTDDITIEDLKKIRDTYITVSVSDLKPYLYGISKEIRDELCKLGFNNEHKKTLVDNGISEERNQTFAYLVLDKKLAIQDALDEVSRLTPSECNLLRHKYELNLNQSNILSAETNLLKNNKEKTSTSNIETNHQLSLNAIKPYLYGISTKMRDELCKVGLNHEHKKILEENGISQERNQTFAYFILDRDLAVKDALDEVSDLTPTQCILLKSVYELGLRKRHLLALQNPLSADKDVLSEITNLSASNFSLIAKAMISTTVKITKETQDMFVYIAEHTNDEAVLIAILEHEKVASILKTRICSALDIHKKFNPMLHTDKIIEYFYSNEFLLIKAETLSKLIVREKEIALTLLFKDLPPDQNSMWKHKDPRLITIRDVIDKAKKPAPFYCFWKNCSNSKIGDRLKNTFNVDFKDLAKLNDYDK